MGKFRSVIVAVAIAAAAMTAPVVASAVADPSLTQGDVGWGGPAPATIPTPTAEPSTDGDVGWG